MLRAIYHSQHFSQSAQREILTDFLPRTTRWGDGIRNNYFPTATKGKKRLLAFQYQVASLLVSIIFKYFRGKKYYFLGILNGLDEAQESLRVLTTERMDSSAILKETITSNSGRKVNISQGYYTKHQPNLH